MMKVLSCSACLTELEIGTRFIPDKYSIEYCPVCQSDDIEIEYVEFNEDED